MCRHYEASGPTNGMLTKGRRFKVQNMDMGIYSLGIGDWETMEVLEILESLLLCSAYCMAGAEGT